ncbi:hypothetical protein ABLA30_13060 [Xenorhabdus nematophila]|uniref:phenylacetate--CoA ligase family protein n=1 Tax=Xenorhabdus nematophila TaxID=628 RepID=UPI0032B7D97C
MDSGLIQGKVGTVYDTQSQDGGFAAISRLAKLNEPSQADTPLLQMAALNYWRQQRSSLLAAPFEDAQSVREKQFAQLQLLVDYAFQYVPFYRSLYGNVGYEPGDLQTWRDFEFLPVINKSMLAAQPEVMRLAPGMLRESCFCSRSSGSSGIPFTTWIDQQDVIRDFAEQIRFLHFASDGRLHPQDWIYTLHHGGFWYSSVLSQYRVFRLMDIKATDVPDLARHLQWMRPALLTTLPSYLTYLAELGPLEKYGIRALTTNSEMSSPSERHRFSRLFGVPVLDEYSSEEIGLMATECLHGSYHVVEDGVYLEILDPDSQGLGRVVVSDLGNYLMPLIRYDHGDLASFDSTPCSCGQRFRRLSTLHGRSDDAFQTANGQYIPSASLLAICDDVLTDELSGIREYRLIQQGPAQVEIQYTGSINNANHAELISDFKQRLEALFGYRIELHTNYQQRLPSNASFKRRSLLRIWDPSL